MSIEGLTDIMPAWTLLCVVSVRSVFQTQAVFCAVCQSVAKGRAQAL